VVTNDGRLLTRCNCEIEPASYTLFGFQRRSLKRRLLFGAIRCNRSPVSKMELEKGGKREGVGRSLRTSADFHVSTYTAHRSWPRDRVNRNQVSAGGRLFLTELLRLRRQGAAEQNSECRNQRQCKPMPYRRAPRLPSMISAIAAHHFLSLIITHTHDAAGDYTRNPCSGRLECYGDVTTVSRK